MPYVTMVQYFNTLSCPPFWINTNQIVQTYITAGKLDENCGTVHNLFTHRTRSTVLSEASGEEAATLMVNEAEPLCMVGTEMVGTKLPHLQATEVTCEPCLRCSEGSRCSSHCPLLHMAYRTCMGRRAEEELTRGADAMAGALASAVLASAARRPQKFL